jgi:protein-disulfide isomerase
VSERVSNLLTSVLVLCAVVVTSLVVRREIFPPDARKSLVQVPVENWQSFAATGSALGAGEAPIRVVEFSDFQCPFCARVAPELRAVQRRYPGKVTVVYRHFPLESIHPHAFSAAVAAECAGAQDRFEAFHDALFAAQDSIGTRPWSAFAIQAAVADTAAFGRCVREQRFEARVRQDLEDGRRAGVAGTPSFIFGGQMVTGSAATRELERWISRQVNAE